MSGDKTGAPHAPHAEGEGLLREALAEAVHRGRYPADRTPVPFADECASGQEYCYRIADSVMAALSLRPPPAQERECAFRQAVAWLVTCARTSGGVTGRDDGLCAALDKVEALFPRPLKFERSKEWWLKRAEIEGDHAVGAGVPVAPPAVPEPQQGSAGAPSSVPEQLPMPPYRYQDDPSMRGPTGMVAPAAPEASSAPSAGAAGAEAAHPSPVLFKTTVVGIGPFCVEFPDGEIVTCRTERRQREIASASALLAERDEALAQESALVDRALIAETARDTALAELEEAKRALEQAETRALEIEQRAGDAIAENAMGELSAVHSMAHRLARLMRAALTYLSSAKEAGR